jgi:hypothetical protein
VVDHDDDFRAGSRSVARAECIQGTHKVRFLHCGYDDNASRIRMGRVRDQCRSQCAFIKVSCLQNWLHVSLSMENTGRSCLMELHYWPNVQFMSKFVRYDQVVIEQHEHYQKGSFRNKCQILGSNGVITMSVPLHKGKHQQTPVREVRISYTRPWYSTHWHTIQTAYGSAPYFVYYGRPVKDILYDKHDTLFALNMVCLNFVCDTLGLPRATLSTAFGRSLPDRDDLRELVSLKDPDGDTAFNPQPYVQVFADRFAFTQNLSVLDLLFCLGPEAAAHLAECL